jgi:hypothetical protein
MIIRAGTASKMSHTALLYWAGTRLWIFEFKEGIPGISGGSKWTPAHIWIAGHLGKGTNIYHNAAPELVRRNPDTIVDYITEVHAEPYGYVSLFKIVGAQYFDKTITTDSLVCSVFAQRAYERCGVEFDRLMSPGMMPDYCGAQTRIAA